MGTHGPSGKVKENMEIHHYEGKHILPGLIDAHTHLGILRKTQGRGARTIMKPHHPLFPSCVLWMG